MTDTPNSGATGAGPEATKATEAAAENTEQKAGGVMSKVKNWFLHSQEGADKAMAKKAGVENVDDFVKNSKADWVAKNGDEAAKIQGKVGKLNKTKAGLVAGAAVLVGSALAGSGNKGPGERATQIREQQQAAELAAMQGQGMGA